MFLMYSNVDLQVSRILLDYDGDSRTNKTDKHAAEV